MNSVLEKYKKYQGIIVVSHGMSLRAITDQKEITYAVGSQKV
jgi:hypothetical protein